MSQKPDVDRQHDRQSFGLATRRVLRRNDAASGHAATATRPMAPYDRSDTIQFDSFFLGAAYNVIAGFVRRDARISRARRDQRQRVNRPRSKLPAKCPQARRTFVMQRDLRRLEKDTFRRPTNAQKTRKQMSIQMKTTTQRERRDDHG